MTISDVAIKRPVFTLTIMLAIAVLGVMSFFSLGTDLFPNVNFPVVTVTTYYPGASPSEVEQQVSKRIEDAVAGVTGLDTVRSFSRESMSTVVVMFKLSADIKEAATDVREKVAGIRLPDGVKAPIIRRVDVAAAPVMVHVATGANGLTDADVRRITDEQLRPLLERVDGVAAVNVVGGPTREIDVAVHRDRLEKLGLPLTSVIDRLRAENVVIPAGHYEDGPREIALRLRGDLATREEVAATIVATTARGTQIPLSEIATVTDGYAEQRTEIRANAKPAVAFEIQKASGANTVDVTRAVDKKLAEIKDQLPAGYETRLIMDTSEFILENTNQIEEHLVFGGAMAILIILLFMLDLRSTFISALALPVSVVGTFFVLDMLGYTLNMMTLMGLSLSIGLLIDDAVVVRENIFRHLELGEDPEVAASKGTQEIALAVLATTLTVVAVFIPVAFMQGVVGQFFKQFGFTVTAAVLLSLLVAFTLDPMLSAKLATKVDHTKPRFFLVRFGEWVHSFFEEAYAAVLRFATRWHVLTVALGLAAFVGSTELTKLIGSDFVAPEDRAQFMVNIELPPGSSLAHTRDRLLHAEAELLKHPEMVTLYAKLGPNTEVNKAEWRVVTTPKAGRAVTLFKIQDDVRDVVAKLVPEAKVTITPPAFVEGLQEGAPLQVQIRGNDMDRLERNAVAIEKLMRQIPGLSDIRMEYTPGRPEQLIDVDERRAASLNVLKIVIGRELRAALEGELAGNLRQKQGQSEEVPVRVRLSEPGRRSIESLGKLPVMTPKGAVPLRELVTTTPGTGPQVIDRQDRSRQIVVSGVPNGRSRGEIMEEFEPQLKAFDFGPDGYYHLDGQVKQMRETGDAIGLALGLGVVFIFLILAAQFESFIHPFTIMLSLPLAFVGAFVALFMTDSGMSMGSNIGIILLMGLVTKNGILLVDAALQNQRDGMNAKEAVLDAGRRRFRPIIMTSAAMVLGMLPTALATGAGSEFRAPMAVAVIGGVVSSTILTLVVIPAVFLWFDYLRRFFGWLGRLVGIGTAALLLLVPVPARSEPLTLEVATAAAIAQNQDLSVLAQRVRQAEVAAFRAKTAWMPQLSLVGTYTHNSDEAVFDTGSFAKDLAGLFPGLPPIDDALLPAPTVIQKKDTLSTVLSLEQTVFAWSPIELSRAAAVGVEAQSKVGDAIRRELAYRVAELFYTAQGLDRLIAAAGRAIAMADARIADAEQRRGLGAAVELDRLRAELEKTRSEEALRVASAGRQQLLDGLGILMNAAPPSALAPVPRLVLPPGELDALVAGAVARDAHIAAQRRAMDATKILVDEAELRWLPMVTLSGYVRWSDTEGFTGENWSWAVTTNLVVPLFDGYRRYQDLYERRGELEVAEAQVAQLERGIRDRLRKALSDVAATESALATAQRQVVLAQAVRDAVERAREAGAVRSLDVAEADTNIRLAEENLANLEWRREVAVLALRHAAGLVGP